MRQLKTKLFNSNFNPDTGVSTVTIKTKRGIFTGVAKVHPEDKEVQSKLSGLSIAEMKATKKFYKEELKRERLILQTIEREVKKDILPFVKNYNGDNYTCFAITRLLENRFYFMIRNHTNNIKFLKEQIQNIDEDLKHRKLLLTQIKEKKGQNNKK